MKICIVGPGLMEIPPKGWGAVEILIHDYRCSLEDAGHDVVIVNTPRREEIVQQVNAASPDFVHIQYDEYIDVADYIQCDNIAITSHYGYLEQPNRWDPGYHSIFAKQVQSKRVKMFCLSEGIANVYRAAGVPSDRVYVTPNGVRTDLFRFTESPKYPTRSIYLAKVDFRKRQHMFQQMPHLYFAGNNVDPRFDTVSTSYLGEWSKDYLYENLTDYANLVLLSDGEAHPLVCTEALSAGLGLVISQFATANLDTSLPFIDVITEGEISDREHVEDVLHVNRDKSLKYRKEIKEYAETFSWKNTVENYCKLL
tara:strand:+ start:2690 stop:3622 length:933 start_codon:yes stop_codon:yes gene_type:complete